MFGLRPALLFLFALGSEALAHPVQQDPRATTTIKNQFTVIKRVIRKANVIVVPQPRTTTQTETAKSTITTDAAPEAEVATSVVTSTQTQRNTKTIAAAADFQYLRSDNSLWVAKELKVRKNQEVSPAILPESLHVQRMGSTKRVPSTIIKTVNTTVPDPRRTPAPKTKTKMTTTTEIITHTNYPPKVTETTVETVSPITIVRETVTRQAASVSTEIVTVETLLPAPDFYEACGPDAFVSGANGGNGIVLTPNFSSLTLGITGDAAEGAYNCCVECMKRPECFLSKTSGNGTYFHSVSFRIGNICINGQALWSYYYSYPNTAPINTYSNGPCGEMENMGLQ
ncbi:hypothetical protein FSPOR_6932 [Fusarium sporotrichioides]|uniref:Apple domain-containing protein n=1 Tax=Fusarium sporotrichioides TaxID=5514 RepID=A0A395S124_FUSSP|nr:hypothetical protein FSPOR_6932 [Fusarium sporotrichioides]